MCGACSAYGGEEKRIQGFLGEETPSVPCCQGHGAANAASRGNNFPRGWQRLFYVVQLGEKHCLQSSRLHERLYARCSEREFVLCP